MTGKFINRINKRLFDFTADKDFSTAFYLVFFYFGVFMYIVAAIMNFTLGLSLITILIPLISAILNITFHLLLFKRGKNDLCILLGVINNNFLFSPFMWLTNLGFSGGFQYFVFMFMLFTVILLKGKSRIAVISLYILEVFVLMQIEIHNPALIITLSGMESNVEDMIFSVVMSLCSISATLFLLSNLYRNEQKRIVELSTTDPLTKQYNRRFIIELMDKMYKYPDKFQLNSKYAVFIDVDDFKCVNDKYGHKEGDRILINLCDTIRQNIRETDFLARMGGDEFLLIINTENLDSTKTFMRRLIEKICKENNITISAGLTKMKNTQGTGDLLEKSDEMMYSAKRAGKNRFFTAEDFSEGALK